MSILRPLRPLHLTATASACCVVLGASVGLAGPLPGSGHPTPHPVKTSRVQLTLAAAPVAKLEALGAPATVAPTSGAEGDASAAPDAGGATRLTRSKAPRSGALLAPQRVRHGLGVVGVTWDQGSVDADESIEVRVEAKGSWGEWQVMPEGSDHGPDPDGPDTGARPGTSPFVVEGDRVQVRVLSPEATAPRGLRVTLVDPGTSDADATAGQVPAGSASAAAARPTILTRRDWGADESMRTSSPGYGQAHIAFVHHTAGTNSYTSAQVPSIIRGIYDYHVNGQGWSDIGYNFLVDRFGRTWEGRYGGVDKAVVGAHTLNQNSYSFGVSAMGDFSTANPPKAMVTAIEKVIAWKFTIHGTPPTGRALARDKTFNRISGHRDAYSTACPGQRLYNLLPTIRSAVTKLVGTQTRSPIRRSVDAGGTADVLAYPGTTTAGSLAGRPVVRRMASAAPAIAGTEAGRGWNVLRNATLSPDLTGDGRPDLVARDPAASNLRIYAGDGSGGASSVTAQGGGWNAMRLVLATGDRDGDGRADLVGVTTKGQGVFYRGDGHGWFSSSSPIGTGWSSYRTMTSVGDLSGDGVPDLMAIRTQDDALVLLPTVAGGGVGTPRVISSGWGAVNLLVGAGDLDADGNTGDLVARVADGRMRSYYADPSDALSRANVWGGGWGALSQLSSGVDWSGDGKPDLLAVNPSVAGGQLVLYAGSGARDFAGPVLDTNLPTEGVDLVRLVGDVDGDGFADAVLRRTSGVLEAARGQGDGRFGTPFAIGSGWDLASLVEPAGDFTNDGVPDLLVRMKSGEARVYSLNRSFGITWRVYLETGWNSYVAATGVGSMNDDFNADLVALRASDGALLLYRGSGPGSTTSYVVLRTGQTSLSRIMGVGDMNGDRHNDILAQDRSGALWLYVGNGSGGLAYGRQPVRSGATAAEVLG